MGAKETQKFIDLMVQDKPIVITENNEVSEFKPDNLDEYKLKELQTAVGGIIEVVYPSETSILYEKGMIIVCNEESKLLGQDINALATTLWKNPYDTINGTAIIIKSDKLK